MVNTKCIETVVIGGGFAGLTAAAELSARDNINVTLVEAADYLGGRVKQVKPFEGCHWLDIGGEFVHGENTSILQLAKEQGWEYEEILAYPDASCQMYTFIGSKLIPLNQFNTVFLKAREVVEKFEEKGRCIRRNLSISNLISEPFVSESKVKCKNISEEKDNQDEKELKDVRLKDLSMDKFINELNNVEDECISLIDALYCQTEGNDISRIGMLEFSRLSDTWEYGAKNFRLKQSYRVLLDHSIKKCNAVDIKLNWQVKQINWNDAASSLVNQRNEILYADYVVITVPLNILKDGDVTFNPDIGPSKRRALECMEMRNGCKIFCSFSQIFWPSNFVECYQTNLGPFTQVWTETPFQNDGRSFYILCGFATGSASDKIASCQKDLLKNEFLKQLDTIFGSAEDRHPATNSFVDYYFYDWGSNPHIRGCYFSPVVQSYAFPEILARPLENKLFFAGEATNANGTSSVQSAIDSGQRVAKEIFQCCGILD